jgi:hypothetical protein
MVTAPVRALIAATIAATAVGFWLSYAGLHAFAFRSGLRGPEAWAWPAAVDLFILAGELGVTISAISGKRDKIAWAYLGGGFVLSVAFNVLHVYPEVITWGPYAVAATPPVAAMLALAALMRQVFRRAAVSDNAVPAPVPSDAGSAAAAALAATHAAGNALSQNQLMTRFGLTRPQAQKLRSAVIPTDAAPAAGRPVTPVTVTPPGPPADAAVAGQATAAARQPATAARASANGSGAGRG